MQTSLFRNLTDPSSLKWTFASTTMSKETVSPTVLVNWHMSHLCLSQTNNANWSHPTSPRYVTTQNHDSQQLQNLGIQCQTSFLLQVSLHHSVAPIPSENFIKLSHQILHQSSVINCSEHDRRCIINMSQFYLHHRIEPKEAQPWESDLWDIIIIHSVLIRIAGLMLCILNEKSSWHGVKMSQNK